MKPALLIVAIACAVPVTATAREVTVVVDAKSGPWSVKINPKMPYGVGDAGPPTIVPGIEPDSGKVEIYPDGKIGVADKTFDSAGDQDRAVDDSTGRKKSRFPSFYTPKVLYPAYAHGLVATFLDPEGKIVGRPYMVGSGVRVPIPEQATQLALGVNDDSFAANTGSYTVKLVLPD